MNYKNVIKVIIAGIVVAMIVTIPCIMFLNLQPGFPTILVAFGSSFLTTMILSSTIWPYYE